MEKEARQELRLEVDPKLIILVVLEVVGFLWVASINLLIKVKILMAGIRSIHKMVAIVGLAHLIKAATLVSTRKKVTID